MELETSSSNSVDSLLAGCIRSVRKNPTKLLSPFELKHGYLRGENASNEAFTMQMPR